MEIHQTLFSAVTIQKRKKVVNEISTDVRSIIIIIIMLYARLHYSNLNGVTIDTGLQVAL